ncbi:hypothetical protein F5Y03DRAFT_365418, partial [Xylaria venustula]
MEQSAWVQVPFLSITLYILYSFLSFFFSVHVCLSGISGPVSFHVGWPSHLFLVTVLSFVQIGSM